jgi:Tfp pilus assembly protein PilO
MNRASCFEGKQPTSEQQMRVAVRALAILVVAGSAYAFAAEEKLLVELNTVESAESRCRLNFVIENKSTSALESMKLDLVVFGSDGGILRRMLTEMAPVRPAKTIVRAFLVDADCRQIGSILVNDVAGCVPGDAAGCLDSLDLSSRLKSIRFYK